MSTDTVDEIYDELVSLLDEAEELAEYDTMHPISPLVMALVYKVKELFEHISEEKSLPGILIR